MFQLVTVCCVNYALYMNVLLIDDEIEILALHEKTFEWFFEGHLITLATSYGEAVEFIDHKSFDLIISDVDLKSDGSGYDLFAYVRKKCEGIPFVFCSANPIRKEILKNKNVISIGKPFRFEEMRDAIKLVTFAGCKDGK